VLDVVQIAGVGKAAGELLTKGVAAVHPAQKQRAAVAGKMPACEVRFPAARTEGLKSESLLATLCHRPFCFSVPVFDSTPISYNTISRAVDFLCEKCGLAAGHLAIPRPVAEDVAGGLG
jgi:hypothetical protein